MRARWVGPLVGLAVILAGCTAGNDSGGTRDSADGPVPTPEQSDSAPALDAIRPDRFLSLVDCWLDPFAFTVDGSKTAALVPPPYNTTSSQLGSVGLQVYACDKVVVNNQTVLQDVTFAITLVPVEPPEAWLGPPDTSHVYIFEIFVPEGLVASFSDAGLAAIAATVRKGEAVGGEVRVEIEDNLWYEALAIGHGNPRDPESRTLRHHYAGADGPVWFDAERTLESASITDEVRLEAASGILTEVSTVPGRLVGVSTPGAMNGVIRFGGPA